MSDLDHKKPKLKHFESEPYHGHFETQARGALVNLAAQNGSEMLQARTK